MHQPSLTYEVTRAFLISAAASSGTVAGFVFAGYVMSEYAKSKKRKLQPVPQPARP